MSSRRSENRCYRNALLHFAIDSEVMCLGTKFIVGYNKTVEVGTDVMVNLYPDEEPLKAKILVYGGEFFILLFLVEEVIRYHPGTQFVIYRYGTCNLVYTGTVLPVPYYLIC